MPKENFVPIQEALTTRISTNLNLPPYLTDKVGLDIDKTTRLMDIGGISHVIVENRDERGGQEPQIVGFDSSGGAYAGSTKSKTKSISDRDSIDLKFSKTKGQSWRALYIAIDVQEIGSAIAQRKDGSLRSPGLWADSINKELRDSIKKEGVSFSLKPSSSLYDYLSDLASISSLAWFMESIATQNYLLGSINSGIIVMNQFIKLINIGNPSYRSDLLYTTHLARAFWATFKANTAYRNLVVAMDNLES